MKITYEMMLAAQDAVWNTDCPEYKRDYLMYDHIMRAALTAALNASPLQALVAALEQIANASADKTDPDLSSEVSWGNYDDVFSDGLRQAEYDAAAIARAALARARGETP